MQDLFTTMIDDIFQGIEIRPVSKGLCQNLIGDLPLTQAQCLDFGVDSADHYRALRAVLLDDADEPEETSSGEGKALPALRQRIVELDAAYGHGALLNTLVEKYAPAYAGRVKFHTSWDEIFGRDEAHSTQAR